MRLHPSYILIAFGLVFCLTVPASTAWMVWQQRRAAIETTGTNLQNLARAIADQTDRIVESVELAEDRLLDHMAIGQDGSAGEALGMTGSKRLHVLMRDIIAGMSGAYALALIDAHGNLVNFSNDYPIPERNLADRQYYQFALTHPDVKSFISETLVNRQTNNANFYVVRRLTEPDGAFAGLLLGAVQVEYLARLFGANTLPPGGSVTLFRPDGTMLARHPMVPLSATQGREAEFRASFFGADRGAIRRKGVFDGIERLTALNDLPRHSLKVAVSVPFHTVVATWKVQAVWMTSIALMGCLVTGVTVAFAIRRLHDQQRLEAAAAALKADAERRYAEQKIAEQHDRFGKALDNMSQGLLMFDASNRLLLANTAMRRIFDLRDDALHPGMTIPEVVYAVSRSGMISGDIDSVAAYYTGIVQKNVPAKFLRKLQDGRQMSGVFVPCDDGWVMTFEDITEARKADERIAYLAMHDALTGLPNRVMLRTRTDEALAAIRGGGGFAVMCLDLDQFKDVNDTLGHPAGDKLLCVVAKRILSVTRGSDVVARLGGDEFAVVAYPAEDQTIIAGMAARLVEAVSEPYEIDGQQVIIGISIGIAIAPSDGTDPDRLMKNADLALYGAKSGGRGRYAFFEPTMEQLLVDRRRLEAELRDALGLDQLELHYQPIVKVATRRIVGFEALMRWRHATRGMIPPSDFISVAEENGSIIQLGAWALNRACLEATRWPDGLKVAVNLSPVQFRSGELVETIAAALGASGLAPNRLELEITESTMMQDTDATLVILQQIKALGVRIAMDDFGTGYSSLAYLQRFPFDKIKIDRAFVQAIDQATNLAIIRAVNSIAGNMGIGTTAEGVETEEQFARVAEERCDEAQGYLFSRPRLDSEIAAMLEGTSLPPVLPPTPRPAATASPRLDTAAV
jgi:diguanylate cyclase (GGDEF)-like protein